MSDVRLTIAVPVYNNERHLATSLTSLLSQTYRDFVLLISDNASTDSTPDICRDFAARDARVQYQRNARNIGMFQNFNRLFELTRTPFIKWSTADDFWAPEFIASAMAVLETDHSVGVVYPQTTFVDSNGKPYEEYVDGLHLDNENPVHRLSLFLANVKRCHPQLGVLRSSCVAATRGFGTYQGGDIAFLADMALQCKFHEIPQRQFFRRFHPESSSWARHDEKHQKRRFYGQRASGPQFENTRRYADYFLRALRSRLTAREKIAAVNVLARRTYWDRELFRGEWRAAWPFGLRSSKALESC
jgi:glycosyltransferase involved in cell wall biosynthesis